MSFAPQEATPPSFNSNESTEVNQPLRRPKWHNTMHNEATYGSWKAHPCCQVTQRDCADLTPFLQKMSSVANFSKKRCRPSRVSSSADIR